MGHWTSTGVEPKDYDDDDEHIQQTFLDICGSTNYQKHIYDSFSILKCI